MVLDVMSAMTGIPGVHSESFNGMLPALMAPVGSALTEPKIPQPIQRFCIVTINISHQTRPENRMIYEARFHFCKIFN